jgi:hypothetical protein
MKTQIIKRINNYIAEMPKQVGGFKYCGTALKHTKLSELEFDELMDILEFASKIYSS